MKPVVPTLYSVAIFVHDIGRAVDGPENSKLAGFANDKPAIRTSAHHSRNGFSAPYGP